MGKREVRAAALLKLRHLLVIRHLADELVGVLFGKSLFGKREKLAVDAQLRGHERPDVKVAASLVNRRLKQFFHAYVHRKPPVFANRAVRSLLHRLKPLLSVHVRAQDLGNRHRPVGVLVLF